MGIRAFEALESLLVLGEYDFARSTLDSLMDRRGYSDEEKEKFGESIWETRIAGAMTAEAFTLSDISDSPFAYVPTGKVTLLNFTSPTCGPCFAELPHLQAFHEKYDPSQVAVILIDVRNLKEQTSKMAEEESLTMPVLLDSESVSRDLYGVYATPTTFIVDQAGRAIFKHTGYGEGQEVMLETEIDLLLERGTT